VTLQQLPTPLPLSQVAKGGKIKTRNTTYTYSTSLMLGLCENLIKGIGIIWRDKEQLVEKQENGITLNVRNLSLRLE